VNVTATIDERRISRTTGRRTDPLRPGRDGDRNDGQRDRGRPGVSGKEPSPATGTALSAAAQRQREQLPSFTPLLEELEVVGWSSHRRQLSGNFHDWILRDDGRVMAVVGQVVTRATADPVERALVAQSAWTAIRAHALHADDAATVLSLAARSLWATPALEQHTSLAVALVDAVGGRASLAIAGDCLVWRVRAATWEQLSGHQPPLGEAAGFAYRDHELDLSLHERLLLVADDPACRTRKLMRSMEASFTRISAEGHRRMTAGDALGIVRGRYERAAEASPNAAASIVALRRR
jgi:serine phosphatase RsbU (regulator of sigma subunit)